MESVFEKMLARRDGVLKSEEGRDWLREGRGARSHPGARERCSATSWGQGVMLRYILRPAQGWESSSAAS